MKLDVSAGMSPISSRGRECGSLVQMRGWFRPRGCGAASAPALSHFHGHAGAVRLRLPVSSRIVRESVLRNHDGQRISEADVRALAAWQPTAERTAEIPFVVARILLQDFTRRPTLRHTAV